MAVADHPQAARGGFADLFPSDDHDLITIVLHPMVVARQQQQQRFDDDGGSRGEFVHLADVYSVAPERLAERYAPAPAPGRTACCWYFICPTRCRNRAVAGAVGEGRWSSETGDVVRPVWGADGRCVGHSRTLSYSYGGGSGGARTTTTTAAVTRHGWCMVELALDDEHGGGVVEGGDFVLCKLFRSSPHNGASSLTAVAVAVAARTAAAAPAALLFDCKRKAVGDHPEAPPSVRQQLVVQHSF